MQILGHLNVKRWDTANCEIASKKALEGVLLNPSLCMDVRLGQFKNNYKINWKKQKCGS